MTRFTQVGEMITSGMSKAEIAAELGIKRATVSKYIAYARDTTGRYCRQEKIIAPDAAVRRCLKCRNPFMSEGRRNHVCDDCKRHADWADCL